MAKDSASLILSQNIRKYRKLKKITQAQLAQRIHKTVEMVCQLENGISSTKISTVNEIADVLGVEVYQLFLEAPLLTIEDLSSDLVEIMHELQDQNPEYVRAIRNLIKAPSRLIYGLPQLFLHNRLSSLLTEVNTAFLNVP